MRLVVLGLGYTARHALALLPAGTAVTGTTRDATRVAAIAAAGAEPILLGTLGADRLLADRLAEASHVLVSAAPGPDGDPFLVGHAAALDTAARARRLKAVVYLSTIGVYGDTGGAWVDETAPVARGSARAAARIAAEDGWRAFADRAGAAVAALRLGGLYGPARNAFVNLSRGTARRVLKPDQVFNRIHVADAAAGTAAALVRAFPGVVNFTDGQPSAADDPILFAAALMGIAPPDPVAYDPTQLSPLARAFWEENRRVRSDRLRSRLGVALRYPTFREGLGALWRDGTWPGEPADRAEASPRFRS
jgi:nucleoside-diphosphate-sugar epimerase